MLATDQCLVGSRQSKDREVGDSAASQGSGHCGRWGESGGKIARVKSSAQSLTRSSAQYHQMAG